MLIEDYKPKFILKKGDKAPAFIALNQNGIAVSLEMIQSEWIVLFFYPQDNTPTCTKEACNLRDNYTDLKKQNLNIYGISPDSKEKHNKFINKYDLPYDLLIDTNHFIATKYGVWGRKKFMGIVFDGIHRTTFVINKQGIIHEIIYPVDSGSHHDQILISIQNNI